MDEGPTETKSFLLSQQVCDVCYRGFTKTAKNQIRCSPECRKIVKIDREKQYRETERRKSYQKQWREQHIEQIKLYGQSDQARAARKRSRKLYRQSEKGKANHKRHSQTEKGKAGIRRASTRYCQSDYGRIKNKERQYIRRHNDSGPIDQRAWNEKMQTLGHVCQICQKKLDSKSVTIDHIFPVSKGGTNRIDNLQPLCKPCNSRKGARI